MFTKLLRYDDAGKFFIKEMELKRKYRITNSKEGSNVKANGWLRRNFSLTGLYYHFSRYGEDLIRPAVTAILILMLFTLYWTIQQSMLSHSTLLNVNASHLIDLDKLLKSFERGFSDFIPILPLNKEANLEDYVIKVFGGFLIFGFIAIALRRKFERKYRH